MFLPDHRFADLDAVLSCCEDTLLLRHNIGQDHEEHRWFDDDDDEEDDDHGMSPRTAVMNNNNNNSNNSSNNTNHMDTTNTSTTRMNNGGAIAAATAAATSAGSSSATMSSPVPNSSTSINALLYDPRKGFTRCLDLIYERHNYGLTNETMEVSRQLKDYLTPFNRPHIHPLSLSSHLSHSLHILQHPLTSPLIVEVLRQLGDYVQPMKLREGDVIMHTTQGSPIDLDEDGLFFIESGCVVVQRDPDQSVALTLRSSRRRRLSVAPRMLRLKHRTFQLSRLGPVRSN